MLGSFLSEMDRRNPKTLAVFRFKICTPTSWLTPGRKKMVIALPAAIRSSLRELWRVDKHHWPIADFSRSNMSGLFECTMMRRRAIIATTRGRRDSRNAGKHMSFVKMEPAKATDVGSVHGGRVAVLSAFEQNEHCRLRCVAVPRPRELSAAQGIRASSSMIEQRTASFAAGKESLLLAVSLVYAHVSPADLTECGFQAGSSSLPAADEVPDRVD